MWQLVNYLALNCRQPAAHVILRSAGTLPCPCNGICNDVNFVPEELGRAGLLLFSKLPALVRATMSLLLGATKALLCNHAVKTCLVPKGWRKAYHHTLTASKPSLEERQFLHDPVDHLAGGYFMTAGGDPSILLRMKEDYDGAEPAASSIAVSNLARLSALVRLNEAERLRGCAPVVPPAPLPVTCACVPPGAAWRH